LIRAGSRSGPQHGRHLREDEDEDEVEEQLEGRDPLLALGVLLAHSRTLPRTQLVGEPIVEVRG
jgi:hypothetical protein